MAKHAGLDELIQFYEKGQLCTLLRWYVRGDYGFKDENDNGYVRSVELIKTIRNPKSPSQWKRIAKALFKSFCITCFSLNYSLMVSRFIHTLSASQQDLLLNMVVDVLQDHRSDLIESEAI